MNHEEKLRRCQQYIDALEEERRKIQAFHRELPLSMQIVNKAIETCRQQMEIDVSFLRRSNDEGTSSGGHMSEELIPIQWSLRTEEDKNTWGDREVDKMHDSFRSLQLNQHPNQPTKETARKSAPTTGGVKKPHRYRPGTTRK